MGPLIVSFELQYSGSFKGTKFNRRFTGCSQGGSPGGPRTECQRATSIAFKTGLPVL